MGLTFLETGASALFARFKSVFEAASGRVLYPAQVENLLLKVLTYVDAERRIATQYAAEQNLVEYAAGPHLDALGANLETPRLQPRPAQCDVVFAWDGPAPALASFPAGTSIKTVDGRIEFRTLAQAWIAAGKDASRPVPAQCTEPGAHANGLAPGVLCDLGLASGALVRTPDAPEGASASNATATGGGGGLEDDEAYRTRLLLAPARFGGGTADGYRLAALTASPDVADALAVQAAGAAKQGPGAASPADGNVLVYVLSKTGDPPQSLLDLVKARCNADAVRLIGDWTTAAPAHRVPYAVRAHLKVRRGHDHAVTVGRARDLALAYGAAHSARLGLDITPTQILLTLAPLADALYGIDIQEPAAALEIGPDAWASLAPDDVTITADPESYE
jgi:phage-related baseplate assembly protein